MSNLPEPLNIWDSFNPREMLRGNDASGVPRVRLFGNRNVGVVARTNLQVAGMVERDARYVIMNLYARTNIHALPAEFHAFTSAAVVNFVVGEMPRCQMPLADLLKREDGQRGFATNGESLEISDAMAKNMYAAAADPTDLNPAIKWHLLQDFERDHWMRVSRVAHEIVRPPMLALIPERQNYSITITADRRALGALLEVLPTNVAPEALVWIHLEGVRRYNVHR